MVAPQSAPPTAPPPARRRRWPWVLALLAAVLAAALGLVASLPYQAWGTRTLLGLLPGLQIEGAQGALLGDFSAQRLRYPLNAHQTLVLERPAWRGAALRRDGAGWLLAIDTLHVERVELQGQAPDDGRPATLPRSLVLPLAVRIGQLTIDTVTAPALQDRPVRAVRAGVQLGRGAAAQHRLDGVSLQWQRLRAGGDVTLQAAAPMALAARLALASDAGTGAGLAATPWQATLRVDGPLARLQLDGRLAARNQSLAAQAVVEPVAPMPLRQLDATLQGLDLAALAPGWPRTALSGSVRARLDAAAAPPGSAPALPITQPISLQVDLRNADAGRWDAGRLPVRSLQAAAASDLGAPEQGRLERLQAELGAAGAPGGSVTASGTWRRGDAPAQPWAVALQAQLRQLQPAALDRRAPALRLSGPVAATWAQAPPVAEDQFGLRATLQGERLAAAGAAPAALQVDVDAEGSRSAAVLRRLEARAGAARLAATGRVERAGSGATAVLDARMAGFDPSLWWPALGGPARLPYRLDGSLGADLQWPGPARAGAAPSLDDLLARLQGTARLQLAESSLVAGVPVAGEATLQGAARGVQRVEGRGRFSIGRPAGAAATEGELTLDGAIARSDAAQRWTLRWQQPRLAAVAPWLGLALPGWRVAGDLDASATLAGRWPQWQSGGQLRSGQLRWQAPPDPAAATAAPAAGELRAGHVAWQLGARPEDALRLQAGWEQARWQGLVLDRAALQVEGSGADHRLQLNAAAWRDDPAAPASVSADAGARSVTARSAAPLRLATVLQAQGGWSRQRRGAVDDLAWQGRLLQWEVREVPAAAAPPSAAAGGARAAAPVTWLRAEPAALRLAHGGGPDGLTQLQVEPLRLHLAEADVTVETLQWRQRAGEGSSLDLRAHLAPTPMAPWLARLQPDFGWAGDLRVAGSLAVQATPARLTAQAELARQDGDLVVQDPDNPAGPQPLGLQTLRLTLAARDGVWRASQDVAGRTLGTLQGAQTVRTSAAARWPDAAAALDGALQLRIAQLGQWGNWLPLGWRLRGALDGQVRLGGRWGEPRLNGELVGRRIAVRNLLQGVDWRDAELRIALAGDTVRLEQLLVHAGTGTLSATGQARLDGTPRVTLQARAERFAVLQRVDRRVVVSGDADGQLDAAGVRLSARLRADEGRIDFSRGDAPTLADDVRVQRPGQAPPDETGAARGAPGRRSLQLDVRGDLGPAFLVSGRGLTTRLAGELRLTSPGNRLQLTGDVRAVDGTYAAYGQKLRIERGNITFTGALDNPRLDVRAIRDDLDDVRVGVAINGTAQAPRVRLYSDPAMSDTERLSWLLLGRAPDGLGGTDLALLQRAAYALFAGESDSPSVLQRLGIDSLSVSQTDGTVRETVVSLGKQLSRRWYLGYERSLQATAGSWQLIYRIAQRFTLRAQTGSENALDLIWSWRWGR